MFVEFAAVVPVYVAAYEARERYRRVLTVGGLLLMLTSLIVTVFFTPWPPNLTLRLMAACGAGLLGGALRSGGSEIARLRSDKVGAKSASIRSLRKGRYFLWLGTTPLACCVIAELLSRKNVLLASGAERGAFLALITLGCLATLYGLHCFNISATLYRQESAAARADEERMRNVLLGHL